MEKQSKINEEKEREEQTPLSEEEAQEAYIGILQSTVKFFNYYRDQVEKAFLYMLHKMKKEKQFYEKDIVKGVIIAEERATIVKTIDAHLKEIETQFDIITNGCLAKAYSLDITVDDIKNRKMPYTGFGNRMSL